MKTLLITILTYTFMLHGLNATAAGTDGDTVIIELTNKSKIVIYTEDRDELENIESYDLNQMIKDLNDALGSKKIQKIELTDESGKKYLKDTTIVLGDDGAKTRIQIGNLELLLDADEWDDIDDAIEDAFQDDKIRKYSYEEKSEKRTKDNFNIDIGLNNWMEGSSFPDAANQPYTLKPFGSWYFAINHTNKTWVSGPLFLEWGFGASWYNFNLEDTDFTINKGDTEIEFNATPVEYNTYKSRLSVPYANITIVPMLDFSQGRKRVNNIEKGSFTFRTYKKQGARVGVGMYAGYRLGGNFKLKYKEDGDKEKIKEQDHFYLQNFRYGVRAQFGFKGLDLFASYDLNEVFSEGKGPAGSSGLNAITFGITL
ncbi:MAG: hypothetical protein ACJA08_003106 [Cyclobacteriaceae bacterium]|jgi:hypothetical protein